MSIASLDPTPVISALTNTISTAYGTTSGTVTLTTNQGANCKWNLNADFSYMSGGTAFTTTGGTSHSTTVTGLTGGNNTIYVHCANHNTGYPFPTSAASTTSVSIATTPPIASTGDDMQTVTAANCPTTRTRVRDARDGATYWIRKIGSLCWMETNLAYAGGGDNTYGDATPAIIQGATSADYTYTEARYFVPTGSNRTSGTEDPSTSTNGTGQYGYLYNWCAAMGRQPAACQGTAMAQPNQSKNDGTTVYNICPAGWRLPTSGGSGEFQSVNAAINSGSTSSDSGLRTNGLYMYSGRWYNGFANQGSDGVYWGSTASSSSTVYTLTFTSLAVTSAGTYYAGKNNGFAVRCVAP